MYIERKHNLGKEEPFKSWFDEEMHFSFKARKGLIGAMISGVIRVNDDSVIMDSDLPGLVTAFVSEDTIRDVINTQFYGLFPA